MNLLRESQTTYIKNAKHCYKKKMVHTFSGFLMLTTFTLKRIFSRASICLPLPLPEKHGRSKLLRILTNSLPVRKCKIELALSSFKLARNCSTFSGGFAFFLSSVTIPGMAFRALETFPPSPLSSCLADGCGLVDLGRQPQAVA